MFFDYVTIAKRAGISREELAQLREVIYSEFRSDEMMADLHLLRVVRSVERGDATIEEILSQPVER